MTCPTCGGHHETTKGRSRIFAVTPAGEAAGLPAGTFHVEGETVTHIPFLDDRASIVRWLREQARSAPSGDDGNKIQWLADRIEYLADRRTP